MAPAARGLAMLLALAVPRTALGCGGGGTAAPSATTPDPAPAAATPPAPAPDVEGPMRPEAAALYARGLARFAASDYPAAIADLEPPADDIADGSVQVPLVPVRRACGRRQPASAGFASGKHAPSHD
jgi:hypothetical protein